MSLFSDHSSKNYPQIPFVDASYPDLFSTRDQPRGIFLTWNDAYLPLDITAADFINKAARYTIKELLDLYNLDHIKTDLLVEKSAIAQLKHVLNHESIPIDLSALMYFKYIPYYKFKSTIVKRRWYTLVSLINLYANEVPIAHSVIRFTSEEHDHYEEPDEDLPVHIDLCNPNDSYLHEFSKFDTAGVCLYSRPLTIPRNIIWSYYRELSRTISFANGMIFKSRTDTFGGCDVITKFDPSHLLLLSGDIETNPGPATHSKELKDLEKQIKQLEIKQRKHRHSIQRQLELEKRDRKKKREAARDVKRYAQTLTDIVNNITSDISQTCSDPKSLTEIAKGAACVAANAVIPGSGTAAATVVTGSKVTNAINKLNPTLDMIQLALKSLTGASEDIRKLFSIPADVDFISIIVSLFSIGSALLSKQLFLVSVHCVQLARLLSTSIEGLMSLIPNFSDLTNIFFQSETDQVRVGQSLVSDMIDTAKDNPQLLPFTGFLSFIFGIFTLLCTGSLPSPSSMVKHFSNIGRAASGFRAFKDMFTWVGDYLSEIYYTTVYNISSEEYQFTKNIPDLADLYAAAQVIDEVTKAQIDDSADIADQILNVHIKLQNHLFESQKMGSRPHSALISGLIKRITEKVGYASHSPARSAALRTLPIALYLFGNPGVGKSVATEVIKARIYKKYLAKKDIKYVNCSFPRKANTEYWEGYTGQPIVILDDFGNVKDSLVKPVEEYTELEYMVNTAQFPLKMAELKSKGVSNFTSEFIIASANEYFPGIVHLTDPGAVMRRFGVWAQVTIDPNFGKPIGIDEKGKAYHQFCKSTAAKHLGINRDDLNPLYTDHYRFSIYKVTYNKQKDTSTVEFLKGMKDLTFDQFFDHFCEKYEEQKEDSNKLSEAIRKEAGIDIVIDSATASDIITKFDKIFNPEKFAQTIATATDNNDDLKDANEDSLFGSFDCYKEIQTKYAVIKDKMQTFTQSYTSKLKNFYDQLTPIATSIKTKLFKIAQFFLSFFPSKPTFFPSVPRPEVLTGLLSTILVAFGAWYTGLFCSPHKFQNWCNFAKSPSDSDVPCRKCYACKTIEYPSLGNMLSHYLDRTGIKSIRNDLLKSGLDRDDLEETRERIRRELQVRKPPRAQAQCKILQSSTSQVSSVEEAMEIINSACWNNCSFCDSLNLNFDPNDPVTSVDIVNNALSNPLAQRIYEHQPHISRPHNYAQRVYESQPRQKPPVKFAQGFVECKTEMHIGARVYAQRDIVQIEQTTQVLLNNSVWIQAVDSNGMCCRSNGVFLVGRTMLTTAHTILNPPHIDPITHIVIRNPYSTKPAITVPIDECKISQIKQLDGSPLDLALVSFPPVVPNRPKILSKFISAKQLSLLQEGSLVFSGFHEVSGKTIVQEKYPSSFDISTKTTEYYLHKPGTCPKSPNSSCICVIKIGNHINYDLETSSGMCGALLSVTNNLIHTKLIGFHVAGGTGVLALGALATQELLLEALNTHVSTFNIPQSYLIDGRLPYSQSWTETNVETSLLHEEGDCLNVGNALSPACPSITQLRPSAIYGLVQEPITKPAHLKPFHKEGEGTIDPMIKGIKKIMGGQVWVDSDLLEAAANDVFQCLGPAPNGKGIVHTYEEAIKGIEGDPLKRPINRTTSPGYPYNLKNPSKGKTFWLGDGEDYIVDNPELKRDVQQLITDSANGIRGNAISLATLKDEKRPIAKVDEGKTRVFEACPQHLVIAMRQYFLDFAAHVMRKRIKNGIAVGINPYSLEWTRLAHHLLEKGDNMIAGDFSNFDGSLLMQVLVKIQEKINEWYKDDERSQLIRAALWEHICNADILVRGEVIRKTHSQPSGNPLTVIINSLFNGIVMRIAYMMMKREQGLPATCDYTTHVSEIIYGDDDVKSVSDVILPWFNQVTLTKTLAKIGLTYTDETKSGTTLLSKSLTDIAFLKRKFAIQLDGTFLAPMDLENILEITNWIKGKSVRISTVENCEQAVMELSLHERQVYEAWSARIQKGLSEKNLSIKIPTHYEQMETYRHNRDMYERLEYVPLW